jgi:hypothetical protein
VAYFSTVTTGLPLDRRQQLWTPGLDRTTLGAQPCMPRSTPNGYWAESVSAEDEDRVGVPQWIDLWSDVAGARRSRRRSAADRPVPPPIGCEAGASSPPSPADTEISLAASAVRRIRSPCKIDACPAFHQCLILARELGLSGNHVYPTASPAACFAGAGRLIAHVVHHIQIVSEGLPLPTSRMHANPIGIYIYRSCADRSRRDPNCGAPSF